MRTLTIILAGAVFLLNSCQSNLKNSSMDSVNVVKHPDTISKITKIEVSYWDYEQDTDKMTSKITYAARNTSTNKLSLQPPYDGDNNEYIVIRKKRGITDAYIEIDKGQFINGIYGTTIKVRFDNRKAMSFSGDRSSDYNPAVMFIRPASTFIANLKKSKRTIIEATYFEAGVQQLEFNTSNLKWEH